MPPQPAAPPPSPPLPSPPPPSPSPPPASSVVTYDVSGGAFPPSAIYTVDGTALQAGGEMTLTRGVTYVFRAAGVSGVHPFVIGSAWGVKPGFVSSGILSGSSGEITVTVPVDYTGSLIGHCQYHSSMQFNFVLGSQPSSPPPQSPG